MYCQGPASTEYSARLIGEVASFASKLIGILTSCAHGILAQAALTGVPVFRPEITGEVVSSSNLSLTSSPVKASPGVCDGASLATTRIWYPPSGSAAPSKL